MPFFGVEFDWDPTKSATNKTKHGISFDEVMIALAGEAPLAILPNLTHPGQQLIVFRIAEDVCVAAVEKRQGVTRIITAQRRRKMRKQYGP